MKNILNRLNIEPLIKDQEKHQYDDSGSLKPYIKKIDKFKLKIKENLNYPHFHFIKK